MFLCLNWKKWSLPWLVVTLVILPAGCISYKDRPLSPEINLESFASRDLDNPELGAYVHRILPDGQWPPQRWGLPELTLVAFYYSPSLDLSRARWAVAEASARRVSERPNPTLGLVPGYNTTTGRSAGISPWIIGLVLDLPIETAGKREYRTVQARLLSESARLDVARTAWDVRRRVREAQIGRASCRERV